MLKIAEKPDFKMGKGVEVRQKAGDQPQMRVFSIVVAEILSGQKRKSWLFKVDPIYYWN